MTQTTRVPGPRWPKNDTPLMLPHVLVVEGDGADKDAWILHPEGCPRYCEWWPEARAHAMASSDRLFLRFELEQFGCYVEWEMRYSGLDSIEGEIDGVHVSGQDGWRSLRPGRYRVEPWYQPPYWAGSNPVDADGGLALVGRENPRWWDAWRWTVIRARFFRSEQLVGVRLPWVGYVALKGPKHRAYFSERNRLRCSVWTLYGGWRIVRRP